jgi:SAM-dependent methyltransferase
MRGDKVGENNQAYTDLFNQYLSHTDGKDLVADNLARLYRSKSSGTVLDIGAGKGDIAIPLAQVFHQVVAVEPEERFTQVIRAANLPNLIVYESKIEEFWQAGKYDLILMSYLLDSMSSETISVVMNQVESMKAPGGKIVAVTYLEGCNWDVFTHFIANQLGTRRNGGFSRLFSELKTIGWYIHIQKILETHIYGSNLDELYGNLSFFYKDNLDEYHANEGKFKPILRSLSAQAERVSLSIREVILEVVKDEDYYPTASHR